MNTNEKRAKTPGVMRLTVAEAKAILPQVQRIAEARPGDPDMPILLRRARFLYYVALEIEKRGGGFMREGTPADYYHACPGYATDPETTKSDVLWMYSEAISRIARRRQRYGNHG